MTMCDGGHRALCSGKSDLFVSVALEPGMVVSMEPMITIPNHLAGAGGYREHDILVITEDGNRNITHHPHGPEKMIIRK